MKYIHHIHYLALYIYTRGIWKILILASSLHNALIKCYQILHYWDLEFKGYLVVSTFVVKRTWRACAAHAQNE